MAAKKQSNGDGVETDGNANAICFSETESKIIHAVLQRTGPSINSIVDWEKVREDLASASVESTKKRFRQISEQLPWIPLHFKHSFLQFFWGDFAERTTNLDLLGLKRGWFLEEPNGGIATPAGKKTAARTPASKNKKAPVDENGDEAVDVTPVKKRKTAASKKVKAVRPDQSSSILEIMS